MIFFVPPTKKYRNYFILAYQLGVYAIIMLLLHIRFAANPGMDAWLEPGKNIVRFISDPLRTLLHLAGAGGILYLVTRDWQSKPMLMRVAFLVLAPALTVVYLVAGQSFEVRVLWEMYPIVVVLSYDSVIELYNNSRNALNVREHDRNLKGDSDDKKYITDARKIRPG